MILVLVINTEIQTGVDVRHREQEHLHQSVRKSDGIVDDLYPLPHGIQGLVLCVGLHPAVV